MARQPVPTKLRFRDSRGYPLVLGLIAGVVYALSMPGMATIVFLPVTISIMIHMSVSAPMKSYFATSVSYLSGMILLTVVQNGFIISDLYHIFINGLVTLLSLTIIKTIVPKLRSVPTWITAPCIWTSIEYLIVEMTGLGTPYLPLGYFAYEAPLLRNGAAVFGVYGLSFWIVSLSTLFIPRLNASRWAQITKAVLVIIWSGSVYFPVPVPETNNPKSLRLVQSNADYQSALDLANVNGNPNYNPTGFHLPVDLIVFAPTKSINASSPDKLVLQTFLQLSKSEHAAMLLSGNQDMGNDAPSIQYLSLNTDNQNSLNHLEVNQDGIVNSAVGIFGASTGKSLVDQKATRKMCAKSAEFISIMTDDHYSKMLQSFWRSRYQLRAIESGRWVTVSDTSGNTCVIAPTGAIVASVGGSAPARLDEVIGIERRNTFFLIVGWIIAPFCLTITVASGVLMLLNSRLAKQTNGESANAS